jgi:hypothetical protein
MTMGQGFHGIRQETPESLLLDAAIGYFSVDESKLKLGSPTYANAGAAVAAAIAGATKIGATRGGTAFETGKELRNVEIDGMRFRIKGLVRCDGYDPIITVNLLEWTKANFLKALSQVTEDTHPYFKELQLDVNVEDAHYIPNIALLGKLSGTETPVILVARNVLASDPIEIGQEDKGEAVLEVKFVAHALLASPHESPVSIYYPEEQGS